MNKNLKSFIHEIYALKSMHRYNNKPKIAVENVAEHMYFTSVITMKLNEFYKFDLLKALQMALIHDLGEIYVGDMTHDVKNKYPKLKEILFTAESSAIKEKFGEHYVELFKEFEVEQKTPEALVVEMADVLSVIQYCHQELLLGNKGYMQTVYDYSVKRLKTIEKKLKVNKK